MLFKLAAKNVRKSFKDYLVYFLTLTFGVCLFYVFNSIESQQAMNVLNNDQRDIIRQVESMLSYTSVFVSFILGFLIVYANRFLMKRRKKELSIYMILGMNKNKISAILIVEVLLTSLAALAAGLVIGIFASQGMSVFTVRMFKANLKNFEFAYSPDALVKTLIYFGIIFAVVMIFNIIIILRCKLITLLTASKTNEKNLVKKLWLSVLIFIISAVSLIFAYKCILHNGLTEFGREFWMAIGFGILGTVLFFMSFSGFFIQLVKKNKKLYYKDLNIFIIRQLGNKINTSFLSMSVICLLLFFSISVFSTSTALNSVMEKSLLEATPYDAVIQINSQSRDNPHNESIKKIDEMINSGEIKKYASYTSYNLYETDAMLDFKVSGQNTSMPLDCIKLSEFNSILKQQNQQPITLSDNEYVLLCNKNMKKYLENSSYKSINFNSKQLVCKEISTTAITNDSYIFAMIVNDNDIADTGNFTSYCNLTYKNADLGAKLDKLMSGASASGYYMTKQEIYNSYIGSKMIITYLAIYLGFVFIITSGAVLALQQLSESSDNVERYKLLNKLGADAKMLNKTLFTQVFIYFMLPLLLAIVHSVVAIMVVNSLIKQIAEVSIINLAFTTSGIILLIYGGYFIATYLSCKSVIRK